MTDTYVPRFETQTDQRVPTPWTNCTFAAGAMLVDWWSWGARRTDDVTLRSHSGVPTNLGANFAALARAIRSALALELRWSEPDGSGNADISWRQLRDHLAAGGGAAVAGDYGNLAGLAGSGGAITRWQPGGDFGHAVFVVDYRPDDGTVLWLDPLGRGTYTGDRIPLDALWRFIYKTSAADADVLVAAAHGFAGARPPRQLAAPTLAGTVSAFGTRLPLYVHTDRDARLWYERTVRGLMAAGRIRL